MKKFNYILRSLFAIIFLAVGVNTALAEEAVYEITSTTAVTVSGVSPDGSSATFENTYTTKEQLTKDNSMTLTLSGFDGCTITGITMSMKSNASKGSGNFTATVGSTTIASIATNAFNNKAWNGAYSTSYVDIKPKVTATTVGAGEKVVLKIEATVNSLYCQSFTITYDAPVTSEPTLKANPTELTFSTTPGSTTEAQTITLTAANLTSDVTYSSNNSAFDVVDNGNDTYDVTFTAPAIEGTTNATLTFSADGVDNVVVTLTGESTNSVTDTLNRAFTGVTSGSTSYSTWSGKTGTSGAVYAGNSAGSNDAIQLRSSDNSGIVTTTSGGTAKSVTIEWQSNTGSTRVLQVYGKNTAYTAATDLYDDNKKGTLIGEIDRNSTSLTIADDYEYIGLRSKSGAMYLSEVQIQWTPAAPADPSEVDAPTFSPAAGVVARGTEVTISTNNGSTLSYTVNGGEAEKTNTNSATVTINEATTIVAKAIAADGTTESAEVTAEYTLTTCDNIAAFITLANTTTAYEITGTVTVTYQNDKNLYVTDASGSLLIYGVSGEYTQGQTLTGIKGKYKAYNGLPEMIDATLPEAGEVVAVEPTVMTIADVNALDAKDYSRYIKLENVNITDLDGKDATIGDGVNTVPLYNNFGLEVAEATNVTIIAVVGYYYKLQVQPIEIISNNPTITVDNDELSFSAMEGEEIAPHTVTVETTNVEGDVTCELSDETNFSVSVEGNVYTVSCTATEVGTYSATLTFSADGAESVEVALTATISAAPEAGSYALVTNASQLNYGDKVVIAAAEYDFALSNVQKSNNRTEVAIEKNANNTITINEGVQILTLDAGAKVGTYSFYAEGIVNGNGVPVEDGYLYAASSSSNHLKTTANFSGNGNNASWVITITDGVASIVAQGTNSHNVMQYNSSSNLFACYAEATQKALSLYRYTYAENIVCEHNYFLIPNAEWTAAAGNYYAKFINKNTGACAWVKGGNAGEGNAIVFYLSQYNVRSGEMPTYTHVVFFKSETAEEGLSDAVLAAATLKTDELAMTETNNIYTVGGGISTGIESVELADGIRYAYGVVEAEGAIEVYNVNGAVVARGNDNLDLRGLNRGIYIVRNGDQVRKVVR